MWCRYLVVALLLLAGAASAAEPPIVGIYGSGTDPSSKVPRWLAFNSRMRELGWRDGENVRLQPRFGANDDAKGDAILGEFVRAQVSVIVVTGTGEALAAQRATSTIPVVVLHMLDPVKLGLIQSLARPGGNITGRTQTISGVSGKQLELIAQMIPFDTVLLCDRVTRPMRTDASSSALSTLWEAASDPRGARARAHPGAGCIARARRGRARCGNARSAMQANCAPRAECGAQSNDRSSSASSPVATRGQGARPDSRDANGARCVSG